MTKAMYPGSFDPITKGHMNIIERAARIFEEVHVVILHHPEKKTMFSLQKRMTFVKEACASLPNVSVCSYSGLSVEIAKQLNADVLVRGVRTMSDYEYEMQIAGVNSHLEPSLETVLMISDADYAHVSSSNMKAVAMHKGDISSFVSDAVAEQVKRFYQK